MQSSEKVSLDFSIAITQLLKGVVYRDAHEKPWNTVLASRAQVVEYVGVIGLSLVVDEAEGYAYLKTVEDDADAIPRLVARRPLSFPVSLLIALLRKKLLEHDATSSDARLVLSQDQIVEMMRVFLPESSNDARLVDQIDSHINKAIELRFLRRLTTDEQLYEVCRIIKAFVDGQWLAEFDARLAEYRELLQEA